MRVSTKRNRALKDKDIISLVWAMLEETIEDIDEAKEPRYGKTFLATGVQQLCADNARNKALGQDDDGKVTELASWVEKKKA